jgi:hypothetical protein
MSLRSVDEAIARADDFMARLDGAGSASGSQVRPRGRSVTRVSRRIGNAAIALGALVAAAIAFGLIVGPIGIEGLFLVAVAMLFALILFSFWPASEPKRVPYSEQLPTKAVVQQLDGLLVRRRSALPLPPRGVSTRSAGSCRCSSSASPSSIRSTRWRRMRGG